MGKKGTYILLLFSAISLLLSSGCGKKEIFVNTNAAYELIALADSELSDDTYYVKDGADFFAIYQPQGKASGIASKPSAGRIVWFDKDLSLVPSLYANELIAYPSKSTQLEKISLERFKEVGWSIGLYGGYIDKDGYIYYSLKNNCIKETDAYEQLKKMKSDSIRIVSINDTPVTKDSINDAGLITGLEKKGQYVIGLYSGTYYDTITITADHYFLESFEVMGINKAYDTKNGYLAIYMNEDYPSGWYSINGMGIFKYYAYTKGEQENSEQDMCEEYYKTSADSIEAYSQQYIASVSTTTENVRFVVSYATDIYYDEEVTAVLIAPDGTQYGMTSENGEMYVEIAKVMAGNWKISIMPQDLQILDVKTESTKTDPNAIPEEKEFVIEEENANIEFYASYEGDGEIWGTVENQNGESRVFEIDSQNHILSTTYAYLPAGAYKVTLYHYADSKIIDIGYKQNSGNIEEEIITITE